jgi:hypothetical protein
MLVGGQGAAPPVKRTSVSIFQLLNEGQLELATLLAESPARAHIDRAVLGIAANLQNACRLDSDAAIAIVLKRAPRNPVSRWCAC